MIKSLERIVYRGVHVMTDKVTNFWCFGRKEEVHSMAIVEGFITQYAMVLQEIYSNVQGGGFCTLIELHLVGCFT